MKIIKSDIKKFANLSDLTVGDVFRFPSGESHSDVDKASFYMIISHHPRTKRVSVMSLDGKTILEREVNHQVVQYQVKLSIEDNINQQEKQ